MGNAYAAGPTALGTVCIMGRNPCRCFLARQTRFVVTHQHDKFSEAFLFDRGRGDFSLRYQARSILLENLKTWIIKCKNVWVWKDVTCDAHFRTRKNL